MRSSKEVRKKITVFKIHIIKALQKPYLKGVQLLYFQVGLLIKKMGQ